MFSESVSGTPFAESSVVGFIHEPPAPAGKALVLTHGAGGNCRAPLLIAVAAAFCNAGYRVLRCDLPFRQRRPFGPPFPKAAAEDRAGLKAAIAAMRTQIDGPVYLGGHSYGGRQASILAADEPGCSDGLLLLSYPLHPPKKLADLRTGHFSHLRTTALFVHGTTDPFASNEEMQAAVQLIPARTHVVTIERAGHDLARGHFDIEREVVANFEKLVRV